MGLAEELMPDAAEAVYGACREAGRQVARGKAISQETADGVSEPLVTLEEFLEGANAYMKSELEKSQSAK